MAKMECPDALKAASTTEENEVPSGPIAGPQPHSAWTSAVQLAVPADAGAVATSLRADDGSQVSSTRHGPPASSGAGVGMERHSVTP
jgi:hypothetical protein